MFIQMPMFLTFKQTNQLALFLHFAWQQVVIISTIDIHLFEQQLPCSRYITVGISGLI
jgi:hypothetical protein